MDLIRELIKKEARLLGFTDVGMARAEALTEQAGRLDEWLRRGYHGTMSWMANHRDVRVDPRLLVDGAQTVISLVFNYHPGKELQSDSIPKIAKYAYGRDYHKVLKKKLKRLMTLLEEAGGQSVSSRGFTDSAPILERDWAVRAGLGWIGKNTLLIHPKRGSYFFLAEIVTTLALTPDQPMDDFCGTCRRCIEACPTDAIDAEGYVMDGSKCISYVTIEHKGETMPEAFKGKMADYAFGCDICQDVCPWNRFTTPHEEPEFGAVSHRLNLTVEDWAQMDETTFDDLFAGSAVRRAGLKQMQRNVRFLNES